MVRKLGEFLDPVADKLMVSALIVLLSLGRVDHCRLVIIGARLRFGLRSGWRRSANRAASRQLDGQIKTISQMVAIPMLLFHDRLFGVIDLHLIGTLLIYVAAVLTVYSMLIYLRLAWPHLNDRPH